MTGATHTNLIFDVVVPFDFGASESTIISSIENAVRREKSDFYCVITIDRG